MAAYARASQHINRHQADNFFPAIRFAETIGRPLNTFVTLNLDHTDCRPELVSKAFERLRDHHFTRWLRYQAKQSGRRHYMPAAYVWVIEHAGGDVHVHWLVHIPPQLRPLFEAKLSRWLNRVAGAVHCKNSAIHVQRVTGARGLGKYMMKGIEPRYAAFYHVRRSPQGIVYGKRCGISKSLGPTQRGRHDHRFAA